MIYALLHVAPHTFKSLRIFVVLRKDIVLLCDDRAIDEIDLNKNIRWT